MDIKRILKNLDWWLIIAVLLLMGCGLGLIDSATHSFAVSTGKAWHVQRQSMFMLFGIVMVAISLAFDYRMLKNYANKLYWFNIILLLAVMFVGHSQLGAQRWIQIGSFTFQPSEFAKAFLIICLAAFIEKRIEWLEEFKDYLPVFGYILVPFVLVMRQPDLGTSLTFIAILVSMIFVSGFKYKWFFRMGVAFVAMLPVFWMILKDYQKNRIRVFLDPEMDPFGRGYHVIQSKIAIGSGGLYGKGWLQGSQSQLDCLPEPHTDFIFAVLSEETGLIGFLILISLYCFIIGRCVLITLSTKENFERILCGSFTFTFMFYIFVNIGMVSGILPVVGVPLPLISYGGTAMITLTICFGMIMSIHTHKKSGLFTDK